MCSATCRQLTDSSDPSANGRSSTLPATGVEPLDVDLQRPDVDEDDLVIAVRNPTRSTREPTSTCRAGARSAIRRAAHVSWWK